MDSFRRIQELHGNEVRCNRRTFTVITVRGTDPSKLADYVEDIRMWTEPTSIGILSMFVPTVRIWTKAATEMIIHGVHELMHNFGLRQDEWNYKGLLDHVQNYPRDKRLMLTGHSMGGGAASIIGMLSGRKVFTLQPPGIYHSSVKHQRMYDRDKHYRWLHHEQSTVVVEGDWINNAFDDHGGLVQKVGCEHPDMSFLGGCHMIEGTACHLLKHCGDKRKRWSSCIAHFQSPLLYLAKSAWRVLSTEWSWTFPRWQFGIWDVKILAILVGIVLVMYYGF